MEPPPPTSPSENPTSAPEATAALIIAIMVALASWACWNERIVSCHADEHGDHEDRTRADGEGRQASEGMTASTFPHTALPLATRANIAASVNFFRASAARAGGRADVGSGHCPQQMLCRVAGKAPRLA